ncbi:MAG: acyl-CoA thioesterase [Pseudomonadota bacterium]
MTGNNQPRPNISASTTIAPEFCDLDPMSVVWHGNHVRYLEAARRVLLEKIGYSYQDMKDSGYAWPVVDLRLRYYRPLRLGQQIEIRAAITEWENRLKMTYQITDRASGAKLARGHTVQVAVDLKTEEMLWQTPPVLHAKLAPYLR